MPRKILDNGKIHSAIQQTIADNQLEIMNEVSQAVESQDIVVVGMAGNPHVGKARKALKTANLPFTYLQYGGYMSQWRKRNAIKMWTGWATFPMIFVKGNLIGGAAETQALINSGELQNLLDQTGAEAKAS
jgi:glutaredoxin-related protein